MKSIYRAGLVLGLSGFLFGGNAQVLDTAWVGMDSTILLNDQFSPYNKWTSSNKFQMVISAGELMTLGLSEGNILKIAFKAEVDTPNLVSLPSFTIRMKHTSYFGIFTDFDTVALTTVYSVSSFTPQDGWNMHALDVPFHWNGTSNLLIETCFSDSVGAIFNPRMYYSFSGIRSGARTDNQNADICSERFTDSSDYYRPNVMILSMPVNCVDSCVWPGDANYDLIADNHDILSLGAAYGSTGPARINPTTTWIGQQASDWGPDFINGVNYKYADCDGNGYILASDTNAVILNYSKVHNKSSGSSGAGCPGDPPLYVEFLTDSVASGTAVTALIRFGTSAMPVDSAYGLAFSIQYDPLLIQDSTVSIDFTTSWMYDTAVNLRMYRNFPGLGTVDAAFSRTDHKSVGGFGTVGTIGFVMEDDISGKQAVSKLLKLLLSDVQVIQANQSQVQFCIQEDSLVVYQALHDRDGGTGRFEAYPNPAGSSLVVRTGDASRVRKVYILNLVGEVVKETVPGLIEEIEIDLASVPSGLYYVLVETEKGILSGKVCVLR